ncbi:MAG TPA: helix-turn-helix transcriptional regulator [Candidatus Aminicenantes bacterium]|nr:helix-turn-helix transcriptional regulator [Candidatus Aminicenantes bacterium]
MESWIRLLSYANLAGAIHALVQSLLLAFTGRGRRRANRFMALFLLALAVLMTNGFIGILGWYDRWPVLSILIGPLVLTFSPLFYFYVKAMSNGEYRWRPWDLVHFVPFLAGLAFWSAFWVFRGVERIRPAVLDGWIRSPWIPVGVMAGIQVAVYVPIMVRRLREYSRAIKASYSTLDGINLRWLKWRLGVFGLIWGVGLVFMAAGWFDRRAISLVGQVVPFLIAVNTFVTGYRAMLQPDVLFGLAEEGLGRRYERSSLSPENAALYKARLLDTMEREKPYLDAEITLPKLAQGLNVPLSHLSQVINEQLGRNFYEFINGYRVEAAKRRLLRSGAGQAKLITIAFECGFNSLATFNRVFKELAGRTPSEFRSNPASS